MNANAYESPKVQLGCGTLILIAIIVAVFSQCGVKHELDSIHRKLDRIEKRLDPAPAPAEGVAPAASTLPDAEEAGEGDASPAVEAPAE